MAFWIPVGVMTVLTVLWTLRPLLKREKFTPAARASYDVQVFKDQLKEIESDAARGVISDAEAARVRTEVSRRLLTAASAEESERPAPHAPKTATYGLAVLITIAASMGGLGLYYFWGQPGLPDLPYTENLARQAAANERPSQAEAEAIIAAEQADTTGLANLGALTNSRETELLADLAKVLEDRPNDLEGHRLLASNLASAGRFIEAHAAQDKVLRILGEAAAPQDHLEHAEIMILAVQGYVSRDAIDALDIVMATIPENPRARYYAGLALAQFGRPRQAYQMWSQLLREGPEDAPWIPAIRASIDDLAIRAAEAASPPGPSDEQVQAAQDLTEEERSEMIRSMVAQLTERLSSEGGTVEEWVRLIGANVVLGKPEAATEAFENAKSAFVDDPEALARLDAAGAQIP